nr:helix-turn-helix domain-containing protein [Maliibacterium massiliense]
MISDKDMTLLRDTFAFWKRLGTQQQKQLDDAVISVRFANGQRMPAGDEACAGLVLVKNGRLRTCIRTDSGKELTMYRVSTRDTAVLWPICKLRGVEFAVEVVCERETELLLLPQRACEALKVEAPALVETMRQLEASRFADFSWVLEQAIFANLDAQLAKALLEQGAIEGADLVHITQDSLAKQLDVSPEALMRMMEYLQQEGMISLFVGGVILKDRARLQALRDALPA